MIVTRREVYMVDERRWGQPIHTVDGVFDVDVLTGLITPTPKGPVLHALGASKSIRIVDHRDVVPDPVPADHDESDESDEFVELIDESVELNDDPVDLSNESEGGNANEPDVKPKRGGRRGRRF